MRFFELNIFACAMGDFSDLNVTLPREQNFRKSISDLITCNCVNVDITRSCRSLSL